jgi:hypothetical protein
MDRAPHPQEPSSETGDRPEHEGIDYKEIAREVLARIDQRLADIERDHPPHSSDAVFHAQTVNDIMGSDRQAALARMAWRGLIGLLLSASLVAAISFLWFRNETAMQGVAQSGPRSDLGSTTLVEKPEPGPPATAKTTADVAPAQAVPLLRTAPDYDKPSPAPVPPELAELLRKFDRNVADLTQAVTELRLARQQEADHNAKTAEDIMASLDQVARAVARTTMARTPVQAAPPKPLRPTSPATAPRARRSVPMSRPPGDALESDGVR